ncbi:hypothetical protein MTR67_035115 [Solanum verrucosum]|uniref:Hydroxyproline O-arabinosyltransferase-like domain-containing protein n=1 Tax=Solanum verrucosum TaxID=315347 RepID=A0AAF0U9P9_SOLVR|nr:hypothetical protein MTR67_035115 [Solanum verrucosum]
MGWGKMFITVVITFSAALISENASFKQEFPGPSSAKTLFSQDPIIKMPLERSNNNSNKKKKSVGLCIIGSKSLKMNLILRWVALQGSYILKNQINFMDEIPTFVAQPLPSGMDQGYIVLNRPWAFVQWLQQAQNEKDYILMSEPDHVIVKNIPNLSKDGLGAAFPFFYIEPKKFDSVLRKFFPQQNGPITDIDPIGSSPEALKKIAPTWMNVSLAMKQDPEADKAFGWVLEMYAYAVASALHNVGNVLHKES